MSKSQDLTRAGEAGMGRESRAVEKGVPWDEHLRGFQAASLLCSLTPGSRTFISCCYVAAMLWCHSRLFCGPCMCIKS